MVQACCVHQGPVSQRPGEQVDASAQLKRRARPVFRERLAQDAGAERRDGDACPLRLMNSRPADLKRRRLDDVARRAGIAKGTIYLYFRDKESLFQELIRTMLTPLVGTIEALGEADMPVALLADRIVDLFVREIYWRLRRQDVIRLMITEVRRFAKLAEFIIAKSCRGSSGQCALCCDALTTRGGFLRGLLIFLVMSPLRIGRDRLGWVVRARLRPLDVRKK